MNLKTGHLLKRGDYRVEKVLGEGGFGITYLCEQTGLLRKVAIKEFFMKELCNRDADTSHVSIPSIGSRDMVERFRQKFIKEARTLAALNHKHIVRIIDVFEENNTAYYVMEYVGGGSLSDKVKDGALPEDEAVRYIRQVATALEFVHGKHMMHLDIKPSNILLNENDETILIDFGLAKQYDTKGSQTSSTPVGISHGYAPLEQYRQGGVGTFSPATDIYSLGATLYKLLTGKTPVEATLRAGGENMPPLPEDMSPTTVATIENSMQLAIANRPQSVGEFLALLDKNVKAENGKVKTESNDDGATVVGGSVMNNEILRSTQNDKEQKPVISTEHSDGENTSTDAGETVCNVVIPNVREESPKKRPSNKRLITIISVAAICIIAAIFGIKSCNDRKATEADTQQATAIAEQQRIETERKAQERADSIAAEQQRQEQERLAKEATEKAEQERIANEAAEKKRKEEERKAKEEADRKAKEEADRKAKEEAEKKRKEEEERKRQEAARRSHGTINGHEYVDLGLPSGLLWGTCNVGANNPWEYGGYYAWGETEEKEDYSWSTYKRCKGSDDTQTKYCTSNSCGTVDNKTVLDPEDDVAHVKWGSTWRMPTEAEQYELRNNCTWTWTTQNGVKGYKVTGPNGNSIFLPAAGNRNGSEYGRGLSSRSGNYWSSSLYSNYSYCAYYLSFESDYYGWGIDERDLGRSVRPVSE